MAPPLMTVLLVAQVAIPLALLAWLAFARRHSRVAWGLEAVLVGTYLIALSAAGLWLVLPWALLWVYTALFALALARSSRRLSQLDAWPEARRGWFGLAVRGALAAATCGLAVHALSGWRAPSGPAIELAFPLASGTYYVANGGSKELLNAHLMTLTGERFRPYRGESYGVDLVKLNPWGTRANGPAPRVPEAYAIFGDPIVAPCAGTVITAVDGIPDMPPGQADRKHMAGNHVIVQCGDAWIVLGHMHRGSVCVRGGDHVSVGQRLGNVGNSENTDEPHLHIHAQRPGTPSVPLGGDPVPILFDGRYLARNALIATHGGRP
jgi:hypothetical protein